MCLSSFWCNLQNGVKENYIVGNPWSVLRRKIELKVSDNKNKTNISHPFHPPHYFWFTMALSGPDPQQWQIAHLIVSRPINQGGSSRLRQMVKLCTDSPFTLDGCVIVYQLFTSVSSQMWHCLVLEAKIKGLRSSSISRVSNWGIIQLYIAYMSCIDI